MKRNEAVMMEIVSSLSTTASTRYLNVAEHARKPRDVGIMSGKWIDNER